MTKCIVFVCTFGRPMMCKVAMRIIRVATNMRQITRPPHAANAESTALP